MKKNLLKTKYKKLVLRHYHKSNDLPITPDAFMVLIEGRCHYCGAVGSNKDGYNGIDRIDSSKGYTIGNVVSCCKRCNMAKGSDSAEEFSEWVDDLKRSDSNSEHREFIPEGHRYVLISLKRWIEERTEFNKLSNCGINIEGVFVTRVTAKLLSRTMPERYSVLDIRKGLKELFPEVVNRTRKSIGASPKWENSTTCFELTVREIEEKLIRYDLLCKEDSITFFGENLKKEIFGKNFFGESK